MNRDQAAQLREPFGAESVGKLPRVWCKACREHQFKTCDNHTKRKCQVCGNNITDAHLHLDYVGHAEITDRLLTVDPGWVWEPVAFDQDGLPQVKNGLWIRLTVAGVTRLGYGSADGKTGPDAVKEMIGDALRNAAMRFGVGLDLWGATYKEAETSVHEPEPDPVEEIEVFESFSTEIEHAKSIEDLTATAHAIRKSLTAKAINKNQYDRLVSLGAGRRAELDSSREEAHEPG